MCSQGGQGIASKKRICMQASGLWHLTQVWNCEFHVLTSPCWIDVLDRLSWGLQGQTAGSSTRMVTDRRLLFASFPTPGGLRFSLVQQPEFRGEGAGFLTPGQTDYWAGSQKDRQGSLLLNTESRPFSSRGTAALRLVPSKKWLRHHRCLLKIEDLFLASLGARGFVTLQRRPWELRSDQTAEGTSGGNVKSQISICT